jgi:hypothetical protein
VIDDATSTPLALWFRPHEDLHGYVTVLERTCRTYGLPLELYGDRLNVFARNDSHWTLAEELRGHQDPTHFGRMLQALGIGFIQAHSPQAKGRIERLWGTLQDRLTSELRRRGISTLEGGNAFLPEFLADFTRRFARPPADATRAWRPVPLDLAGAARARAVEVFQRLNALDPAAVAAEELTPEAVPFLRFEAAAQEVFDAWRAALEHRRRAEEDHPVLLSTRLSRGRLASPFTAREVYRQEWTGLTEPRVVQGALECLEALGWIRPEALRATDGGRPTVRFHLNPRLRADGHSRSRGDPRPRCAAAASSRDRRGPGAGRW